jgi:hypothetical protein
MYSGLFVSDFDDANYKISGRCVVTGESYYVIANKQAMQQYKDGEYVQVAFPNMSKDDREFLISGISPEGWDQTFDENPDEFDDFDDMDDFDARESDCGCIDYDSIYEDVSYD